MTTTTAAPVLSDATPRKTTRPIRDLFEGLGIALLMAIFYKYFAIEAYQIPTSSMQPTMMGSTSAKVYDRLIVDKFRYAMFEPQQWDIAVFKYPIRQNQNYVKRIVGTPGARLRIAGGNIYGVAPGADGTAPVDLTIHRKPELLQSTLWKEVYPARLAVEGGAPLERFFAGRGGEWSHVDDEFRFAGRGETGRARLTFQYGGAGLSNLVWDGYPTEVASKIRPEGAGMSPQPVQDARLAFALTAQTTPSEIEIAVRIELEPSGVMDLGMRWSNGQGRLFVDVERANAAASEPFDLTIAPGATHEFRFAHYDDLLTIEVDGAARATLECGDHKLVDVPRLVTPSLQVTGGGELRVGSLVLERDLHYVPSSKPGAARNLVIEVPDGHYLMLGDNTLQSVDSRDWTRLTIGVLDGRIVDPKKHPEATLLEGNLRPVALSEPPDPDENPLPIVSKGKIVFTDRAGEVHTLEGKVASSDGRMWAMNGEAWFEDEDGVWQAETGLVQFAPREHLIGRPLVNFWPWWRIGLIR